MLETTTTEVLSALLDILVSKDTRVHEDIRRGKTIISDAVVKLGESFNGLNSQTRTQQQLVASLIDEVSQEEGGAARSGRASVRQIADGMSEIMSRFIDMLTEVSAQSSGVISKMETMNNVMNETFSLLANVEMITKQTNLLSLNAFIEAARSGEAGRGFQVVASEMRNLSQSSAKLNEQIRKQVEGSKSIVQETRDVVMQMAMRDISALSDAKGDADALFEQLAAMNNHLTGNLSRVSEITVGIDRSVGLAVQSLQFEDIVGQLLGAADRELTEQEEGITSLREHLQAFVDGIGNGEEVDTVLGRLNTVLQEIRANSVTKKSTTVLQQSMDEGDVELF